MDRVRNWFIQNQIGVAVGAFFGMFYSRIFPTAQKYLSYPADTLSKFLIQNGGSSALLTFILNVLVYSMLGGLIQNKITNG